MTRAHALVTGCQEILLKKHKADQKIFLGRDEGGQQDFAVKPTRLTPEIELSKDELNSGKSLQWDAFRQEENKQPLGGGIISPSWTLALLPISCTNLVQPEKYLCWCYWAAFSWIHSLSRSPAWVEEKPFLCLY